MQYKIQVFEDDGAAPDATDWLTSTFEDITTDTNKLYTLNAGTKYYWRVIVLNASDEVIDYSATRSFTTGGGASVTPVLSWPIGVTVLTNTPTLYWYTSPQFNGGAEYQVRYSLDNVLVADDPLELDNGVSYPIDGDMALNGTTD